MRHGGHAQVAVLEAGVSACKTGCGKEADRGVLCATCAEEWLGSPEFNRFHEMPPGPRRDVAVVDFCNRVRAERQARRPA